MSRSEQVGASVGPLAFAFALALVAGCASDDAANSVGNPGGGSGGSGSQLGGTGGSQTPMGTSGSVGNMGGMSTAGTNSAGSTSGGMGGTGGTASGGGGGGTGGSAGGPTQGGTGGTPEPQPMCVDHPQASYQNFDGEAYTYVNWWGTGTPSVTPDGYMDSGCYSTSTMTDTFVQIGTTFPGYNSCASFADITAVNFYAKATVAGTVTVQLDLPETTPTDQQTHLPLASCAEAACKWKGLTAKVEVTTEWAEYSVPMEDFKGNFPLNEEQAVLRMFWEITGMEGTTFGLSIDEVTFE